MNSVIVAQYCGEALLIPIIAVNTFLRLLLLVGLTIAQCICRIFWFLLCLRSISAEWHHTEISCCYLRCEMHIKFIILRKTKWFLHY